MTVRHPPWKRPNPKKASGGSRKLAPAQKHAAKKRANSQT